MIGRSDDQKMAGSAQLDAWFAAQGWTPQLFQREVWTHMAEGRSGLLNAPTGTGKTYAVWGGVVNHALLHHSKTLGLKAIWITPLRALAGEIAHFTGVTDPYEPPDAPEVTLFTDRETKAESLAKILDRLESLGYIPAA